MYSGINMFEPPPTWWARSMCKLAWSPGSLRQGSLGMRLCVSWPGMPVIVHTLYVYLMTSAFSVNVCVCPFL